MVQHSWLIIPFFLSFYPTYTAAYTWQFTSQPRQCQNVSVAVQGSGQPPYSLLLFPYGPTPFPNNTEVRKIQNISFPGDSTSLSFNLNYPENSSFVAVISDSSGFGTGGISAVVTVLPSSDSTCYNSTHGITLPWYFYIDPIGGIAQCQSLRLWWDQDLVDGNLTFYGLIPGGTSFFIPQGYYSTNNNTGTGFSWTVDVAGGTDVLVIGSDDRGFGSGGEADFTVASSTNTFCLSGSSPSSAAGDPAGASYPTSTSGSSNGRSEKPSNTGAIAGGVAGGLALMVAFASITFFYARRLGYAAISKERPVNVLYDDEDGDGSYQDLPDHYEVEPYLVSDPNIGGTSVAASSSDRLISMTPADSSHPQGITTAVTTARKNALPAPLRPTNIIQHDDAGPREGPASVGEPEVIELPPAYTNIRSVRSPDITPTSTTASSPIPIDTTTP